MSSITNLTFRLKQYANYKLKAVGSHALHSPFVFKLFNEVIKSAKTFEITEIENLRKHLLKRSELLEIIDFKTGENQIKTIGNIAKKATSRKKFSSFLHLLTKQLEVKMIMETGTSLGINTLYLSKTNVEKVVTIEGSQMIARLAQKNFDRLNQQNIELINSDLYGILEQKIVHYKPELYFLDADHRSSSIVFCIDLILKHTPQTKCIVIHDIYWSKDMSEIWAQLAEDPRFSLSIDIFEAGILLPNREMAKQHFFLHF